jgi:hypothetical protein
MPQMPKGNIENTIKIGQTLLHSMWSSQGDGKSPGSRQRARYSSIEQDMKEKVMSNHINPGPKPVREDGKDDQRHHVNPPTAPKHPTLPLHNPPKKK